MEQPWPVECSSHFAPKGSGPYVVPDGMDAIKSMADGRTYDSRSAYYKSLKSRGYEIAESKEPSRPNVPMDSPINELKRAMGR